MVIKWGILSTGKICNDFVRSLAFLPCNEHKIVGVAARSKDSAVEFAKEHGIPNAYNSYEEMAVDKSIDIIYIGTVNTMHYSLCKLMLEAGKNVLCEKPLTLTFKHTQELVSKMDKKTYFDPEEIMKLFTEEDNCLSDIQDSPDALHYLRKGTVSPNISLSGHCVNTLIRTIK